MDSYIPIGCEIIGRVESTYFIDPWIHMMNLGFKLNIIATVLDF